MGASVPSLVERLKDGLPHSPDYELQLESADVERAAAVCAAVEAFQAAEQALEAAPAYNSRGVNAEREAAYKQYDAAKARLLEVNLG